MSGSPRAGRLSSPKRKHEGRLAVKDDVPKDNIKRVKPTISPEKVYKYNFIRLPSHLKNKYNHVSLDDYMTTNYSHGTAHTLPTVCPNKDKKVYKLRLRLTAPFDASHKIAVLGSIPELGNFQMQKCFLRFNQNNEWILDQHLETKATYFQYKYVVLKNNVVVHWEDGLNRIADLEALPEISSETNDFVSKQQSKISKNITSMKGKSGLNTQDKWSQEIGNVNNVKNVFLYDEWETYTLKLSIFEPFDDPKIDVRLQGNHPQLQDVVMTRADKPSAWLQHKYGKKVQPFEVNVKMRQASGPGGAEDSFSFSDAEAPRAQPNRLEYCYSLKLFGSKEVVYEREPHRVLEIQDPLLYRGQMGACKNTNQDSHKVYIVNGHIERQDGNFNGGFYFNKVRDANIVIGTYPLT